jgi:hypothetical protein
MSDTYSQQPAPTPAPQQYGQPTPTPNGGNNGLATAGFVLALLGLLGSWIPFLNVVGILLAIIGLVLAGVGLAKSRKTDTGKGLAIAGLVLGALALVVAVIVNVAFVGAVDQALDETTGTSVKAPGDSTKGGSGGSGDSDLGTSRENPAPLGSEISGGDWNVTINSVKTTDQDSMGQKAASGSTLLVVNMTATYTGDDEQGESAFATVNFVTPDGTTIDSTSGSTFFIAENEFDVLEKVYNGASVKGDQIFEVPADSWKDGVLAVSPDMLSDDTFVAVQ